MKRDRKEPLYRKEKKTGLQTRYYIQTGGEYRWGRNTKAAKQDAENEISFQPINGRKNTRIKRDHKGFRGQGGSGFGYDYTPLYMFLQSKVGQPWDKVYSEAKSRLDHEEPIWYMVEKPVEHRRRYDRGGKDPIVRIGEGSAYRALKIDEDGILQYIDKNAMPNPTHGCICHTQTFNGVPRKIVAPNAEKYEQWRKEYREKELLSSLRADEVLKIKKFEKETTQE